MDCDLLIRGGTVVDGTGAPATKANVAIAEGRIVAVGDVSARAARTIDATDRVVAPGFIDLHTHYDAQILWDRMLTISPWHGVTTSSWQLGRRRADAARVGIGASILRTLLEKVEGMSSSRRSKRGAHDWPFETFWAPDVIDRRGSAINVAAMVGHTPVRSTSWRGDGARAATAEEYGMRAIAREVAAGAIGFATPSPTHRGYAGKPVPSRLAELDEVKARRRARRAAMIQATAGPGLFRSSPSSRRRARLPRTAPRR
jgi:N-acyl-D-aspartate/D-glutamate deacylase